MAPFLKFAQSYKNDRHRKRSALPEASSSARCFIPSAKHWFYSKQGMSAPAPPKNALTEQWPDKHALSELVSV
ncbi:MAG: hypothetical protein DBY25_06295 [Clostridiales bacterium]|nr:MAG: hypothetical protein DBY25_06295 [Clostridiales bacterium]